MAVMPNETTSKFKKKTNHQSKDSLSVFRKILVCIQNTQNTYNKKDSKYRILE